MSHHSIHTHNNMPNTPLPQINKPLITFPNTTNTLSLSLSLLCSVFLYIFSCNLSLALIIWSKHSPNDIKTPRTHLHILFCCDLQKYIYTCTLQFALQKERTWLQFAYQTASTTHVTRACRCEPPTWTSTSGPSQTPSSWGRWAPTGGDQVRRSNMGTQELWTAYPAGKCTWGATRSQGKRRCLRKPRNALAESKRKWWTIRRGRPKEGARGVTSVWFSGKWRNCHLLLCLEFSRGSCLALLV